MILNNESLFTASKCGKEHVPWDSLVLREKILSFHHSSQLAELRFSVCSSGGVKE